MSLPLIGSMPALLPSTPEVARLPRTAVRWSLQHGAARAALTRAAARGDLQAQLIMDPAVRADPYPTLDRIRDLGPLAHGRHTWVSADHRVCQQVLRSDDFGALGADRLLPPWARRVAGWAQDTRALGPIDPPSLLAVEPPDHTRYRKLVSKVFTARAVEAMRAEVQTVADGLLDGLEAEGLPAFDLVERYATMLPVVVIAGILGVPPSEHRKVLDLGNRVAASLDVGLPWSTFREVHRGLRDLHTFIEQHLERLRRDPGTDLLSQLVTVEDDGVRLTPTELRSTAGLLLGAGFETTVNLLSSGTRLLLEHPDQLAVLRAHPEHWPTAVEEVLRLESPVQLTGRVAERETLLEDRTVRPGQMIITFLAGANRDPAVFADPNRFDVTRANARDHLAFSGGRHFCLGAALARVEGDVGLRSLFDRFPHLALAPGARRRRTRVLRGWETLPVTTG